MLSLAKLCANIAFCTKCLKKLTKGGMKHSSQLNLISLPKWYLIALIMFKLPPLPLAPLTPPPHKKRGVGIRLHIGQERIISDQVE